MHTALSLIEADRYEIARRWLLETMRQTPFPELASLPVERIVGQLPDLVSGVLGVARGGVAADEPDSVRRLGRELGGLRRPAPSRPAVVARDLTVLHGEITQALLSRTPGEAAPSAAVLERLNRSLSRLVEAAVAHAAERTASGESPTAASEPRTPLHDPAIPPRDPRATPGDSYVEDLDPLTGLPGRSHLLRELRHRSNIQHHHGQPFAVILVDLDGLDRINSAFGRAAGDAALVRMADILRVASRAIDTAARVGEDELCLVAPEHGAAAAAALAARVQVAGARIELPGGSPLQVSAAGVASPEHAEEPEALLEAAETALYRVKASGSHLSVR